MQLPVLVSTPHASGFVPFHLLAEMLGEEVFDREARERRLEYLFDEGDPYTDAIFYALGARHLSALTSRFVVDLNRPRDYGGPNGVIKLTDFQAQPLYPPDYAMSPQAAEERLSRYWDPYHAAVDAALARNDISFFIDGHAMSPVGPAIGPDTGKLRPALTLVTGGDARGEPLGGGYTTVRPEVARELASLLWRHFRPVIGEAPEVPQEVSINAPFIVGEIIRQHASPLRRTSKPGFMIEVNRALYLEPVGERLSRPIPGRIEALNGCFNSFLGDAVGLMAEARVAAGTV